MSVSAGWFPDPEDQAQLRYWDGEQWTEHRSPVGQKPPSAKALAAGGAPEPAVQPAPDTNVRQDIAQAKSRMATKIGSGREIRKLTNHLWEGERVERMTSGAYGAGRGLVVLTDRRLIFLKEGMMAAKSEDFPIAKISSIQWESGMVMGSITIFASGNKAEINHVNKADGKEIVDLVRSKISGTGETPPQAAAPAGDDVIGQIHRLGELRDAGVLTAEEFDAKKAELLKRL